jgi:hypothetical protein
VRHHAKASSAGSTQGQGRRLGSFLRGALAPRAFSIGVDGSGGPSARRRLAIGLLAAALGLLVLAPGSTASILTRARTASFGADGTVATDFGNPGSLAFDQASDKLYVLDRVDFSGSSALLHAFDTPALSPSGGAFPKTLAAPGFEPLIAVDSTAGASAGNIYYVAGETLYGFDSSGAALGGNFPVSLPGGGLYVGAAVDSAGNVYVVDGFSGSEGIRKYDSAGNFLGTIGTASVGNPGRIAFDSNDDLYFGVIPLGQNGANNEGVWKATAASGYSSASFTKISSDPPFHTPAGIAVDTSTHTLYVAEDNHAAAYNAGTGAFLYEFASGIANASFSGIAVDQATDTVYVSDISNSFSNPGTAKVYAFGPAQSYGDATATPTAAKNVTDTGAEIGATITDNNVLPTNWRLESSFDGGTTWNTVKSGQTAAKSAVTAATGLGIGTLTVKAGGGTFSLVFGGKTTTPLAYNASAAAVQSALQALSTIGAGNVEVTGGPGSASGSTPYNVTFTGALSGTNVSKIFADANNLFSPPETVSASLSGLDPNSDYRFRVLTNKGSGATDVVSPSLGFKTVAPPPVITDVGAVQVADTSARLVGTIDPRNTETGYVFQYGTTPALGSSTAPLNIGSGTKPITVSQVVGGLSPDTTYYFRLVATNLTGTATSAGHTLHTRANPLPPASPSNCPNAAVRQEQSSSFLPDCRAYEMTTPTDKNQGSAPDGTAVGFSRDGQGVAFCSTALFGEPAGQMSFTCAPYISRREPSGWTTSAAGPRYCPMDRDSREFGSAMGVSPSPESYDRLVVTVPEAETCPIPPLDPTAPLPSNNLYREDGTTDPFSYDLLTPNPTDVVGGQGGELVGRFVVGNDDFNHIVYGSTANQTPDSPPQEHFGKLYDWEEEGYDGCAQGGGCLSLLSRDTSGNPFTTNSTIPGVNIGAAESPLTSAISSDGERIYFQNRTISGSVEEPKGNCEEPVCDLYLRENGTTTIHVSATECTANCGVDSSPDIFRWADRAGDKALFVSCAKLTDASAEAKSCNGSSPVVAEQLKLYRWDRNGAPGHRLVDLTVDHEPADGSQPDALEQIGASADGDTVYFVAGGQIVSGGPTGSFLKLYRWRWNGGSPGVDYLGPYLSTWQNGTTENNSNGFESTVLENDPNADRRHSLVTPDGEYLLIRTKLELDPAADRDSDSDLYRWHEGGDWLCISCQLPGVPSAGHVDSYQTSLCGGCFTSTISLEEPEYSISDDGRHVFFSTPDALVPEDVNGEAGCPIMSSHTFKGNLYSCTDVYEWHDGTVSLVTSGTGSQPFTLIGATHTGEDVFFATGQPMVGWDADNSIDVYDARVGGGFPEPPAQPAICESEACTGPGTSAPDTSGAGTAVFEGPGNPPAKHRKARKHHKKRHHKRWQRASHNRRAGR